MGISEEIRNEELTYPCSPKSQRWLSNLMPILENYNYDYSEIIQLVKSCDYNGDKIQEEVGRIMEMNLGHEQGEWEEVKSRQASKSSSATTNGQKYYGKFRSFDNSSNKGVSIKDLSSKKNISSLPPKGRLAVGGVPTSGYSLSKLKPTCRSLHGDSSSNKMALVGNVSSKPINGKGIQVNIKVNPEAALLRTNPKPVTSWASLLKNDDKEQEKHHQQQNSFGHQRKSSNRRFDANTNYQKWTRSGGNMNGGRLNGQIMQQKNIAGHVFDELHNETSVNGKVLRHHHQAAQFAGRLRQDNLFSTANKERPIGGAGGRLVNMNRPPVLLPKGLGPTFDTNLMFGCFREDQGVVSKNGNGVWDAIHDQPQRQRRRQQHHTRQTNLKNPAPGMVQGRIPNLNHGASRETQLEVPVTSSSPSSNTHPTVAAAASVSLKQMEQHTNRLYQGLPTSLYGQKIKIYDDTKKTATFNRPQVTDGSILGLPFDTSTTSSATGHSPPHHFQQQGPPGLDGFYSHGQTLYGFPQNNHQNSLWRN